MSEKAISFSFIRLLVSEAIRELNAQYSDFKDRDRHVETRICNLGKKPGFAMALVLSKNKPQIEQVEDIGVYIAQNVAPALFGVSGKSNVTQHKVVTISFVPQPPAWFTCLTAKDATPTPEEIMWHRNYAQFFAGVCVGVFSHFGYRAQPNVEQANQNGVVVSLVCESLQGSWEFSCRF